MKCVRVVEILQCLYRRGLWVENQLEMGAWRLVWKLCLEQIPCFLRLLNEETSIIHPLASLLILMGVGEGKPDEFGTRE